uniref:uncharacterized protein n=1 Tax=Myxine glutinosa TaxID=7769 RepID=UPI00358EFE05
MSNIVTPSEFYIHLKDEVVSLKRLHEELQHIYSSTSPSLNFDGRTQDMPGSLCCVFHKEDLYWYRGKIVGFKMDAKMDQDYFFVFLLDSGNSFWFTRNHLKVLLPIFHDMPGFAVKCCLHNIRVANANSRWGVWDHEAVHHFTKLTGFSAVFLGEVLNINVHDFFEIIVKDTTQLLTVNINEEMVSSGLAIYIAPPEPLHSQNVLQPVTCPADKDHHEFHARSAPLSHPSLLQPVPSLKGKLNNGEEAFGDDNGSHYLAFTSTPHRNQNDETGRRHAEGVMTFIENEYTGSSSITSTGGNIKKQDNLIVGNYCVLPSKANQNNGLKDDPVNMNGGVEVVQSDTLGQRDFLSEDVEAITAQPEQIPCNLKAASLQFSKMPYDVGPPTSGWEREIATVEPRKMPLNAEAAGQIERNVWATEAVAVQPGSVSCDNTPEDEQPGSLVCDVGVAAAMNLRRFPHHDSHPDLILFDIEEEEEDRQQEKMPSDMSFVVAEATMKPESRPCHMQPEAISCDEASVMQSENIPFEMEKVIACWRMLQCDDKTTGNQAAYLPYNMQEATVQSESMPCDMGAAAVQQCRMPYAINTSLMQSENIPFEMEKVIAYWRMLQCDDKTTGNQAAYLPYTMQEATVQSESMPCDMGAAAVQQCRMPYAINTSLMQPQSVVCNVEATAMDPGNNPSIKVASARMQLESKPCNVTAVLQPENKPCNGDIMLQSERRPCDVDTIMQPIRKTSGTATIPVYPETMLHGKGALKMPPECLVNDMGAPLRPQIMPMTVGYKGSMLWNQTTAGLQPRWVPHYFGASAVQPGYMPCDVVAALSQAEKTAYEVGSAVLQPEMEFDEIVKTERIPCDVTSAMCQKRMPSNFDQALTPSSSTSGRSQSGKALTPLQKEQSTVETTELLPISMRDNVEAAVKQPKEMPHIKTAAVQMEMMPGDGEAAVGRPRASCKFDLSGLHLENIHHHRRAEIIQTGRASCDIGTAVQPKIMARNIGASLTKSEQKVHNVGAVTMKYAGNLRCNEGSAITQQAKLCSAGAPAMQPHGMPCDFVPPVVQRERTSGNIDVATLQSDRILCDFAAAVPQPEKMPSDLKAATMPLKRMSCDVTPISFQPQRNRGDVAVAAPKVRPENTLCDAATAAIRLERAPFFVSAAALKPADSEQLSVALSAGFVIPNNDNVCRLWRYGRCWRGTACRFEHALPDPTGLMGMVEEVFQEANSLELPFAGNWIFLKVTAIHNVCHFWVQLPYGCELGPQMLTQKNECSPTEAGRTATLESYASMLQDLQKYYVLNELSLRRQTLPASGELVAARLSSNGPFYRGRVYDVNPEDMFSVKVFFLDIGNTEWLREADVLQLLPQFLHVPFQAVEVYLHELELVPAENVIHLARDVFENIVHDKLLVAQVMQRSPADELWVLLYIMENSTAISINQWLVGMGFCRPKQPRQQNKDTEGTKFALKVYPG